MNSNSTSELPYRTLKPWLRETFGKPVHRVALDAGSTCPNRDGTLGFGGCFYCDVDGSGTGALKTGADLAAQLETGIRRVARRDPEFGVIAYFQSYSNTYVDIARLREVLSVVEPRLGDPVVAVSIATRPDTLPDEALRALEELSQRVPVWVEIGLEAANDRVLTEINRLHTVAEYEEAVQRVHQAGLLAIGHAILGLPGDGREGAQATADCLRRSAVSGVKVHHLMVLKRTVFEKQWRAGELEVLEAETYVQWLADFVERLGPKQVLHRITGDAPPEDRLAPYWKVHKSQLRDLLAEELSRRGTYQGALVPQD
ncbi:MAG: TIGR01212 family radical SAM protein [Planctomycetota bacterium]